MKLTDLLPSGLGPNPPAFPLVSWPLPIRFAPKVQEVARGLYQAAYMLGFADGMNAGLTVGIFAGCLGTILAGSAIFWAFFKQVRSR